MKPQPPNPRCLDVAALCRAGAAEQGQWPLAELERLSASLAPEPQLAAQAVTWSVHGSLRQRPGAAPQRWLRVRAAADVRLLCQRCLEPVEHRLQVERAILFVDSEDEAQRLDEELEDDVLALPARFDLQEWVEDELILALPLVPRHDLCPAPLAQPEADERPRPFEVLAQLRRGGS